MSLEKNKEIFVNINGFKTYCISNSGRVKALKIKTKFGLIHKTYPERFVKSWITKKGYHYVTLSENGIKSNHILHRLVAVHFIGNPNNYPQVNHKDGDKSNNLHSNLEWCTSSQNLKHARDLGLNNSIGINNALAKFNKEQILSIRLSPLNLKDLSEIYGVSISVLSRIRSFKSYKNV